MKKYVLTGGPGSGKSTMISYLELEKNEVVVKEAAEDCIKLRQVMGNPKPWKSSDFQSLLVNTQINREFRIPKDQYITKNRIWLDRGLPDNLAYCNESDIAYRKVMNYCKSTDNHIGRYDYVFVLDTLVEHYNDNGRVRRESVEEAIEINDQLYDVYKALGYNPIKIPAGSLQERSKKILEHIKK
jgi:predicted ATPase